VLFDAVQCGDDRLADGDPGPLLRVPGCPATAAAGSGRG